MREGFDVAVVFAERLWEGAWKAERVGDEGEDWVE